MVARYVHKYDYYSQNETRTSIARREDDERRAGKKQEKGGVQRMVCERANDTRKQEKEEANGMHKKGRNKNERRCQMLFEDLEVSGLDMGTKTTLAGAITPCQTKRKKQRG